jgi:hypothetical protein
MLLRICGTTQTKQWALHILGYVADVVFICLLD